MPGFQLHSFHPALSRWQYACPGLERALQNFGGQRHWTPFMVIIIIMVRAIQTTKLQVFFPYWLFAAQIALETEWNVQWFCGCLVVGMATCIHTCLDSPINLNEPSPKPPLVFGVETKPQNTSTMFVASDQLWAKEIFILRRKLSSVNLFAQDIPLDVTILICLSSLV